jgi:AbrB family looped-hinge helix DNA binding protein
LEYPRSSASEQIITTTSPDQVAESDDQSPCMPLVSGLTCQAPLSQPAATSPPCMPKVRVNYEGWIALPVTVRQRFGINTGDQLEIEIVDGGIVLRPASGPSAADRAVTEAALAAARAVVETAVPEPTLTATPPSAAKRGLGRPRKAPAAAPPPPAPKVRGRRTAAPAAE